VAAETGQLPHFCRDRHRCFSGWHRHPDQRGYIPGCGIYRDWPHRHQPLSSRGRRPLQKSRECMDETRFVEG